MATVRLYIERVDRLAADGARVIVLPEELVGVTYAYRPAVVAAFGEAARRNRVTLVAGVRDRDT